MGAPQKERHTGIELLRIFAAMAVVILHLNFHPAGGGVLAYASGINRFFLTFLECLSVCAVNVFILISGRFSPLSEKIRLRKLLLLLVQTIFFQLLSVLAASVMSHSFSAFSLLGALIPVNYYIILYLVLMLLSPFIHHLINGLHPKAFSRLMLTLLLLFSVMSTAVDIMKEVFHMSLAGLSPIGLDGSMGGYTIVNFILVYILGIFMQKNESRFTLSTPLLLACLTGLAALLYLWRLFLPDTAWMYSNSLVIAEAYVVVQLFSRVRFRNRLINRLAPASLTCYLIHEVIISRLPFDAIAGLSFPLLLLVLVAVPAGIYVISFLLTLLWQTLSKHLFRGSFFSTLTLSASGVESDE